MIPIALITHESLDQLSQALRRPNNPKGPARRANKQEREDNWRSLTGDAAVIGDMLLQVVGTIPKRLPLHARAILTPGAKGWNMRSWYLWAVAGVPIRAWGQNDMRHNYAEYWIETSEGVGRLDPIAGVAYDGGLNRVRYTRQDGVCYGSPTDNPNLKYRCLVLALLNQHGLLPLFDSAG